MKIAAEISQNDTLAEAGIDPDEFDFMSDSEKEEALEEAGVDGDNWDFS